MADIERCTTCPIPRICAGVAEDLQTLSPEELSGIYTPQYLQFLREIDTRSVTNGFTYIRVAGKIMECLEGNPNCVHRRVFLDFTSATTSTD